MAKVRMVGVSPCQASKMKRKTYEGRKGGDGGKLRPATHCAIFNNLMSSRRATLHDTDLIN